MVDITLIMLLSNEALGPLDRNLIESNYRKRGTVLINFGHDMGCNNGNSPV